VFSFSEFIFNIFLFFSIPGETTIQPPKPVDEPPPDQLPGKKKYIPPYTPVAPTRTKSFSTTPTNVRTASSSATSNFKPRTSGNSSNEFFKYLGFVKILSKYVCFVTFFFVEYVRTSESSE
jgi:hypothetical protein